MQMQAQTTSTMKMMKMRIMTRKMKSLMKMMMSVTVMDSATTSDKIQRSSRSLVGGQELERDLEPSLELALRPGRALALAHKASHQLGEVADR